MRIRYTPMDTPVGPVVVAWKGEAIVAIQMKETKNRMGWSKRDKATSPEKRLLADLKSRFHDADVERSEEPRGPAKKLARYFAGSVHAIDDLPVDPGGTPFQAKIWKRLCEIPTGETMTYGELAASVGHPDGARAAAKSPRASAWTKASVAWRRIPLPRWRWRSEPSIVNRSLVISWFSMGRSQLTM